MSDYKYKASSSVPSNQTEKLLHDTELSKGSKALSNEAGNTKSASEISELQIPSMERLGPGISCAEKYPQGASSSQSYSSGSKNLQEGGALRPRLLVVANRLPVTAVKRIEDFWSVAKSSGGPVTALLGKFYTNTVLSIIIYLLFTLRRIFMYTPVSISMVPRPCI